MSAVLSGEDDAISPTAEGVGVNGGGLDGDGPSLTGLRRLVVGVRGVTKTLASALSVAVGPERVGSAVESTLFEGRPRFLLGGRTTVSSPLVFLLALDFEIGAWISG